MNDSIDLTDMMFRGQPLEAFRELLRNNRDTDVFRRCRRLNEINSMIDKDFNSEKINYSKINFDNSDFIWCYSSDELSEVLTKEFVGQTLRKVYVDLLGYSESFQHSENYYDFSYMGGSCIMVFESKAIIFCIHCQGLIEYKIVETVNMKISDCFDFPEYKLDSDEFCDLENQFQLKFANRKVINITVDCTGDYAFFLQGYGIDEQKLDGAAQSNTLPNAVHFHLDNKVDFGIYGDDIEYYYIKLK